jgi:hypothetical protein
MDMIFWLRCYSKKFNPSSMLIFAILTLLIITVYGLIYHALNYNLPKESSSFLIKVDTSFIETNVAKERLHALTEIVLQGQANEIVYSTNLENRRMQTRLFYMAILAGLFSAIFINYKQLNYGSSIALSAIVLMFTMYYYDVRMEYQSNQRIPNIQIFQNTIDSIVVLDSNVQHWYSLDPSVSKISNGNFIDGLLKRLVMMIRPSIEQVLYYFIPLILLLTIALLRKYTLPNQALKLTE